MSSGVIFLGSLIIGGAILMVALNAILFWSSRKETRRGAELTQLVHLESLRFWARDAEYWERANERWADHELLMRTILEIVDRGSWIVDRGQGDEKL